WPHFDGHTKLQGGIPDGLNCTILYAEKMANMVFRWDSLDDGQPVFNCWVTGPSSHFLIQPQPFSRVEYRAQGPHAVLNVAMADGSVRGFNRNMQDTVWWAFCTPAGNDQATFD